MIDQLPFIPTSCLHDYRYHSVFYGEPFLFGDYIYYFDGRDARIIAYNRDGHPPPREALVSLFHHIQQQFSPKTITVESSRMFSVQREFPELERWVLQRRNARHDFEMILDAPRNETSPSVTRSLKRAAQKGLCAIADDHKQLTHQHYRLIESFVRAFEWNVYFKAEFVASIVHLIARPDTLLVNCSQNGRLLGFLLAAVIDEFGVFHATIALRTHNGIGDVLYRETIISLSARGARKISLGFSLNKGLLAFKTKWGAAPTWKSGHECIWCERWSDIRNYMWATRIARRL